MANELYNQLSKYIDASYRVTKNYQQEVDFILRPVEIVRLFDRDTIRWIPCQTEPETECLNVAVATSRSAEPTLRRQASVPHLELLR